MPLTEVLLMKTTRTKNGFTAKVFFLTALLLALILSFTAPFAQTARAAEPTDEIEHFIITVDVQEDASLLMTYHIDWKVLDDETYGPLEWVNIGLPNSHHSDVTAIQNVNNINDKGSSLDIYLDRNYYEDEVVSFEFSFVQDHMYQIDRYVEGETVFAYTPAWFDGIEVKDLTAGLVRRDRGQRPDHPLERRQSWCMAAGLRTGQWLSGLQCFSLRR